MKIRIEYCLCRFYIARFGVLVGEIIARIGVAFIGFVALCGGTTSALLGSNLEGFKPTLFGAALMLLGIVILTTGFALKDPDAKLRKKTATPFQYLNCPNCTGQVKLDTMKCPHCGFQLYNQCSGCGQIVPFYWKTCAYCDNELIENRTSKSRPTLQQ